MIDRFSHNNYFFMGCNFDLTHAICYPDKDIKNHTIFKNKNHILLQIMLERSFIISHKKAFCYFVKVYMVRKWDPPQSFLHPELDDVLVIENRGPRPIKQVI